MNGISDECPNFLFTISRDTRSRVDVIHRNKTPMIGEHGYVVVAAYIYQKKNLFHLQRKNIPSV